MRRLLVLMLLLVTQVSFAKLTCQQIFAEDESHEAVQIIEKILSKENRVPTAKEVAEPLGIKVTELKLALRGATWSRQMAHLLSNREEFAASTTLQKLKHKILKSWVSLLEDHSALPELSAIVETSGVAADVIQVLFADEESYWSLAPEHAPTEWEKLRKSLIKLYATQAKELGRTLTDSEVDQFVGDRSWVLKIFTSEDELRDLAKATFPKLFAEVIDLDIFNPARHQKMLKAIENHKRLVVTTAVAGASVNLDMLEAIRQYCTDNDAELIVIPANMQTNELDPVLLNEPWIHVLTHEVELTEYLRIANIKITAKQFNPLTSLDDIGPRNQSMIVSSPKMHMRTVPTAKNGEHPHILHSTGALTNPNYAGRRFIQKRTDYIAQLQHRMGALILERSSSESVYHTREIEFIPERKGFYDVNRFYTKGAATDEAPLALTLGDLHVAKLDREVFAKLLVEIAKLQPKTIVLHDIFDGDTVNGHTSNRLITRGVQASERSMSLAEELSQVIDVLNELLQACPSAQLKVVRSNHDMWIDRWLETGEFMKDAQNQAVGIMLAEAMSVQKFSNPLEYAIKHLPKDARAKNLITSQLVDNDRVLFLELGSKETIGPKGAEVLIGAHGHAGINGAKGISLKALARVAGKSIKGHTHTVARENDAVNVGTLTRLDLEYNRDGFSNWVQSIAIIGPNGEVQLLIYRNGEFYSLGNSKKRRFFSADYPHINPNADEGSAGQIDQYGE